MNLLAIDPGPTQSAWLRFSTTANVLDCGIIPNDRLLSRLRLDWWTEQDRVVIEKVESFGMAVGAEVFETVYWSGRFAEAAFPLPVDRIGRKAIKVALCGTTRATDSNIRAALIDRFGGSAAIGTKKAPGPLHGVTKDVWSALAVAVAWTETQS